MSKHITVLVLLIIAIIGCDDTKNPLEGTKWLLDDNGTTEYVHFDADQINDYYYDDEFLCFYYDQIPYSVDGSKITAHDGEDIVEFSFHITDGTLTIINTLEPDTAVFVAIDFDADTLDICGPVKRLGKSFFNK